MTQSTLKYIGVGRLGLATYHYSQCERCGALYPHATSGRGVNDRLRITPGPMRNGYEITTCPYCQPKR